MSHFKSEQPYQRFLRERRAAAVSLSPQSRDALARASLASGVAANLARQRGARLLEEHRLARTAEREGRQLAAVARAGLGLADAAAGRGPDAAMLAARRRDEYRRGLGYPMRPEEVLLACDRACDEASIPASVEREETLGYLVGYVMRRHGTEPIRADVPAGWLRAAAARFHARESFQRERATGLRASASLRAAWERADADEKPAADGGPDAIWYAAANMAAPVESGPPLSAAALIRRLRLSERQGEALALALEAEKRATVALSGAQRKAAADARRILRGLYPDAWTLRLALAANPGPMAAAAAVDRCIALARASASAAARGSHLAGQRASASTAALSRLSAPRASASSQPAAQAIIGPQSWSRIGDGYSGACTVASRLRAWATAAGLPVAPLPALPQRPAATPQRRRRAIGQGPGFSPPYRGQPALPASQPAAQRAAAREAGLAAMNATPLRRDALWQ